jgi:hypothetical protein
MTPRRPSPPSAAAQVIRRFQLRLPASNCAAPLPAAPPRFQLRRPSLSCAAPLPAAPPRFQLRRSASSCAAPLPAAPLHFQLRRPASSCAAPLQAAPPRFLGVLELIGNGGGSCLRLPCAFGCTDCRRILFEPSFVKLCGFKDQGKENNLLTRRVRRVK